MTMKQNRRFFYFSQGMGLVLFFAFLIGLGFFAKRYAYQWDLSDAQAFTLSEQSRSLLYTLDKQIAITAVFSDDEAGNALRIQVKDHLAPYLYELKKMGKPNLVSVRFLNPNEDPQFLREHGLTESGMIHFKQEDRETLINTSGEREITGAILKVTSVKEKIIRVLSGHGERAIEDMTSAGLSTIVNDLRRERVQVEPLFLTKTSRVPDNTDLLIVSTPTKPLLKEEMDLLLTYSRTPNARLLFLLDPPVGGTSVGIKDALVPLLSQFSIQPQEHLIVDPENRLYGTNAAMALVYDYPPHAITAALSKNNQRIPTLFPLSQGLKLSDTQPSSDWEIAPILQTSASAWGERDTEEGEVTFTDGKDDRGPLVIAYALQSKVNVKSRVVVVGDSDFITNAFYDYNRDLALNMLHWLEADDEANTWATIRPKDKVWGVLMLTPLQAKLIFVSTVIVLPLLFIALAIRARLLKRKQ